MYVSDCNLGTRASPELDFVFADENNLEVDYFWTWNVTELGQTLRSEGKVYPNPDAAAAG
jgi:hypothetical protein